MKTNDNLPRPLRPQEGLLWGNLFFLGQLRMLPGDIRPLWEFQCTVCNTVDANFVNVISKAGNDACLHCKAPDVAAIKARKAKAETRRKAAIRERARVAKEKHQYKMAMDNLYAARYRKREAARILKAKETP